ncbi:hypothetical protein A9Q77_11690, partial [Marinomonas sp. 42_23_T18]
PDEKRLRKACGRGKKVIIVNYNDKSDVWWQQNQGKLSRFKNLSILRFEESEVKELEKLCQRSMQLNVTIQDAEIWVSSDLGSCTLTPRYR